MVIFAENRVFSESQTGLELQSVLRAIAVWIEAKRQFKLGDRGSFAIYYWKWRNISPSSSCQAVEILT